MTSELVLALIAAILLSTAPIMAARTKTIHARQCGPVRRPSLH